MFGENHPRLPADVLKGNRQKMILRKKSQTTLRSASQSYGVARQAERSFD
jgi:hypothetical protein